MRRDALAGFNILMGLFMRTKFQIRTLLAVGLLSLGLCACSDGDSGTDPVVPTSSETSDPTSSDGKSQGNDESSSSGKASYIDTTTVVDPETGVTKVVYDTIYRSATDTLHWVGNSALVITEITPINLSFGDENGEDPSWVEIYNAGTEEANLRGYSLLENRKNPDKWVFGNEKIPPKSFRIVFCDKKNLPTAAEGEDTADRHFRTHASWKMDKAGGTVYLVDANYGIRDSVVYPEITMGDVSWGITDGGIWKLFDKPTPEQPNTKSTGYDSFAPTLDLSQIKGGFYNEPVTINPPQLPSGVKLRCTKDGSLPTKSSEEFNNSMTIDHSMPLRCSVFKDGALTTQVVTKTFFIGESVSMPVVAVSVDPSFFVKYYKKTNGGEPDMDHDQMYAPNESYPNDSGELPVHVEYFEKGSNSSGSAWDIEAGISLMGGWSRMERKKSVAIVMREEYQDGWLHYSLFDTRKSENDKYKAFNLRNNGNRFVSDYFADALGGAILEGSGVDYQRSRQVVVFYNGEYRGIHDMRERFNKNYVESNYGIDASTVNFIKHLGEAVTASNGTTDDYLAMLEYVAANDFSGENNASYEYIKGIMDVGNFADYMIAEMYIHNGDWPNNNVRAWRNPDHPWKFMIYDLDHGFDWKWGVAGFGESTNMFKWVKQGGRNTGKCYTSSDKEFTGERAHCFHVLYTRLIKNPDFKRLFINHSAVMLEHYLNAEVIEKVRAKMAGSINESEAERDLAANGQKDRYYDDGFTVSYSRVTDWARERDRTIVEEYKSEFDEIGGTVTVSINSNGNGMVKMDGMKLPGSTATSTKYSGKFFSGGQMELTAVPSGGSVFDGWSGCEAVEGAPEPTCRATITDGLTITAKFK